MGIISLRVGRSYIGGEDLTYEVSFEGEELGSRVQQHPVEYRGTRETLYKTTEGRLLVYTECPSNDYYNKPEVFLLEEIEEKDLLRLGRFEWLGKACGFAQPLKVE